MGISLEAKEVEFSLANQEVVSELANQEAVSVCDSQQKLIYYRDPENLPANKF
jgi:hypothetical protein